MSEHSGTSRSVDPPTAQEASRRLRRIDALQRAHRAREVLDRATELVVRDGNDQQDRRSRGRTGDAGPDVAVDDPAARSTAELRREDFDRLMAIHRGLQRERYAARRPFHRHSDRLVLALELAERLALERLGYADYADFECHQGDDRPDREIIDLVLIEKAERDLADAEATLTELDREDDARGTQMLLPMWTNAPDRRWVAPRRATRTRRLVFGARRGADGSPTGGVSRLPKRRTASASSGPPAPVSGLAPVTPLPIRLPRRDRALGGSVTSPAARTRPPGVTGGAGRRGADDVVDLDELVLAGLELDIQLPEGWSPTDRTDDRTTAERTTDDRATDDRATDDRATDDRSFTRWLRAAPMPDDEEPDDGMLDDGVADDGVLGEIVHNGRSLRIEKVGGLVYDDDDDDPSAGAITYGDPNRPD